MERSVHNVSLTSSLLIYPSFCLADIQIAQLETSPGFELRKDGWVMRRNLDGPWQRMCWLPYKRRNRGFIRACHEQRVVIGAQGGTMTILDFSNV
jgi:hypothetical protein